MRRADPIAGVGSGPRGETGSNSPQTPGWTPALHRGDRFHAATRREGAARAGGLLEVLAGGAVAPRGKVRRVLGAGIPPRFHRKRVSPRDRLRAQFGAAIAEIFTRFERMLVAEGVLLVSVTGFHISRKTQQEAFGGGRLRPDPATWRWRGDPRRDWADWLEGRYDRFVADVCEGRFLARDVTDVAPRGGGAGCRPARYRGPVRGKQLLSLRLRQPGLDREAAGRRARNCGAILAQAPRLRRRQNCPQLLPNAGKSGPVRGRCCGRSCS